MRAWNRAELFDGIILRISCPLFSTFLVVGEEPHHFQGTTPAFRTFHTIIGCGYCCHQILVYVLRWYESNERFFDPIDHPPRLQKI